MNSSHRNTPFLACPALVTALILASLFLGASQAQAASLLLDIKFNETGTTALNSGSFGGSATLTQYDGTNTGTAADLHSVSGGGVSGLSGDYAFNNTASTGMGSSGNGGAAIVTNGATMFSSLKSFTIAGWYKTDGSSVAGNFARVIELYNSNIGIYLAGSGALQLSVKGSSGNKNASITNSAYSAAGSWVFFAVTYDGTLSGSNYTAYVGSTASSAVSAGSVDLLSGTVSSATGDLYIGNASTGTTALLRPLDASLDNFAIYGSSTDSTGALALADVEALRASALAIPEPSTVALLSIGGVALLILSLRNRKTAQLS